MFYFTVFFPILILFFTTVLSVYIFFHNKKSIANKLFALQILSASFWIFSNFMADISVTPQSNLFWSRITLIGATLVSLLGYFFSLYFPQAKPVKSFYNYLVLFFGIFIILLSPTSFNIVSVYRIDDRFGINIGPLYFLFLFYFTLTVAFSFFNLFRKANTPLEKKQVKFIVAGILISAAFSCITNAVLPVLGNSNYVSWGPYFIVFFLIFTSYAIVTHHLLNIKVITTELFVLALWIILLIKIFFSKTVYELTINSGILGAVLIVGILLVRGVIREIRQREEIEKMARDIEKAYQLEKQAREELENLDKSKNQFLLAIQHHLRTPLTSIMGYCDLLLDNAFGKPPKKIREIIKKTGELAQSLIKMVNEFLDITQFQLGKGVIMLKPGVAIEDLVKEIFDELKIQAEKKNLYFNLEIESPLPLIEADREKLKVALYNIFDNAIKYTPQGGIDIKVKKLPKSILISVKDTGIGISKETMSKLFKVTFERGEEAKKHYMIGRGIGLYLSSEIIKAHKGRIWAESEGEGKGSIFFVELPL